MEVYFSLVIQIINLLFAIAVAATENLQVRGESFGVGERRIYWTQLKTAIVPDYV
ncbi:MAG: hypothetical protein AAFW70_23465 [Cyanobacteria bacterium J06635_10]